MGYLGRLPFFNGKYEFHYAVNQQALIPGLKFFITLVSVDDGCYKLHESESYDMATEPVLPARSET